jgi:hypothetical protein
MNQDLARRSAHPTTCLEAPVLQGWLLDSWFNLRSWAMGRDGHRRAGGCEAKRQGGRLGHGKGGWTQEKAVGCDGKRQLGVMANGREEGPQVMMTATP